MQAINWISKKFSNVFDPPNPSSNTSVSSTTASPKRSGGMPIDTKESKAIGWGAEVEKEMSGIDEQSSLCEVARPPLLNIIRGYAVATPSRGTLLELGFEQADAQSIKELWRSGSARPGKDLLPGMGVFYLDGDGRLHAGIAHSQRPSYPGITIYTIDDKGRHVDVDLRSSDTVFFHPHAKMRLTKADVESMRPGDYMAVSRFEASRKAGFARGTVEGVAPQLHVGFEKDYAEISTLFSSEKFSLAEDGAMVNEESGACVALVDLLAKQNGKWPTEEELSLRILELVPDQRRS